MSFSDVFSYKSLVHAISGATGGVTAITVFFPLNNVRLRLQVNEDQKAVSALECMKTILKEEGVEGLYRGWVSAVVSLGASNFVYFYTYNGIKTAYQIQLKGRGKPTALDPITNLAIASIAGVINVLVTTPLWVVGTRLSTQRKKKSGKTYTGIWNALTRIANEEGVSALWKGVWPSLVLVSNPSIQFVVYENLKRPMLAKAAKRGTGITPVEFFAMGAIAKAVATVLTYPLQIAQSRLRADQGQRENQKKKNYSGTFDVLWRLWREAGLKGLFKGMEAKLWQTVLTAAFQFLTYEQVVKLVFWLLLRNDVSAKPMAAGFGDQKKA
mmetsp:Transcript_30828/g.60153  ORF Transcript_30828/g.60153 Transcript_30828/m.60153 type:complete len:326 (+) Transcript_30828:18-995(+)